jgi:hypothetical protein
MTPRKPRPNDVDRALRLTLPDDIPAGVEAELRLGIRQAWTRAAAEGEASVGALKAAPARVPDRSPDWGLDAFASSWAPWPRPALAAAAVLMIVAAGVASPGASPAAVETIASTQTASGVLQRLREVTEMECVLETADAQGRSLRYVITWRSGGETAVRIEREGGTDVRRITVPAERTSLATLHHEGQKGEGGLPADPTLSAARSWLAPERLARSLAGAWNPIPGAASGEASFRVSSAGGAGPLRVTIDERTRLPVRVEALPLEAAPYGEGVGAAQARFDWQTTSRPAPWPTQPRGAL